MPPRQRHRPSTPPAFTNGGVSGLALQAMQDKIALLEAKVNEQHELLKKHTIEKDRQLASLKLLLRRFQAQHASFEIRGP